MNKIHRRLFVLLLFSFILTANFFAIGIHEVQCQPNVSNRVQIDVQIYDIDLSTDVAKVDISIIVNYANLSEASAINQINISGENQFVTIFCNVSNISNRLEGSSGIEDWKLTGDLGRGEYAPFEVYELRFELTHPVGSNGDLNVSDFVIDQSVATARFVGSKEKMLGQVFNTPENHAPFWNRTFGGQEAVFYLTRRADSSELPVLFWLLIMPTLASMLVLASTLALGGRKNLGHRLTVYLALFIFGPTFFTAIQQNLPLRAGLSIPEVLLVSLIMNTALFTGMSLVQPKRRFRRFVSDGVMVLFSFFITSYIFLLLMPVFPVTANPVVSIVVVVYSVIAVLSWNLDIFREIKKTPRNFKTALFQGFGILFIDFGFIIAGWSYGILPSFVGGLVLVTMGITLFALGWNIKKRILQQWGFGYG